ncbi:MAG: M28 family peptidase, partial [Bacteroidota bacterium]
KEHIIYLADDDLAGRETGTEGEDMAALYITRQFTETGLKPAGPDNDWLQDFEYLDSRYATEKCALKVSKSEFKLNETLFPFPASANGEFSGEAVYVGFGIHAPDLKHDDYKGKDVKGKVVVIDRGSPDKDNPHGKFAQHAAIGLKAEVAQKMGAMAVIFVNPEKMEMDAPTLRFSRRVSRSEVPMMWLKGEMAKNLDGKMVTGNVEIADDRRTGHNVIGLLDHGAEMTVVFGAHYDHLGMGEEGSLHRGEKAIHNGADDNASGVAMIIELANELKKDEYKRYNYLFIAFSGEEKGLLGSNFYCKNPTIDLKKVNCMLNFDMVGRLDPAKNTLGINATGTSPFWEEKLPGIQIDDMKIKTSKSGVGPSDHTSFYLKDIPVLHFFSGTHGDYHKPSDDAELINYDGMSKIYRFVVDLTGKISATEQLTFTKTKNEDNQSAPRWKVTLGVVPDYLFDGEGMRIDGVTDGRPASKAGMKAGDVVVKMGAHEVKDMMGYMRALSKFDKGDKVKVYIMRDGEKLKKKVKF